MGAYLRSDKEVDADLERVLTLLPRLRERYEYLAGRLSGGEQQMVAIARGLMGRPKMLLIDEMSLGLAPVLVDQLLEILQKIHDKRGSDLDGRAGRPDRARVRRPRLRPGNGAYGAEWTGRAVTRRPEREESLPRCLRRSRP